MKGTKVKFKMNVLNKAIKGNSFLVVLTALRT